MPDSSGAKTLNLKSGPGPRCRLDKVVKCTAPVMTSQGVDVADTVRFANQGWTFLSSAEFNHNNKAGCCTASNASPDGNNVGFSLYPGCTAVAAGLQEQRQRWRRE